MYTKTVSRTLFVHLFLCCLPLWGGLIGCSLASEIAPKSTPLPLATSTVVIKTPTPTATTISVPELSNNLTTIAEDHILVSQRYGFTITLPMAEPLSPTWQFHLPPRTDMKGLFAQIGKQTDAADLWLIDQIQSVATDTHVEVLAFLVDEQREQQLTMMPHFNIIVMPRHGLHLSHYLEGIAENLSQLNGVELRQAGIDYNWRPDGIPTASIRYERLFPSGEGAERIIAGHQVAFFDRTGDNILLGTFVVSKDSYDEMLPTFREVITNIRFPTD